MRYILGLGSNIEPGVNTLRMIAALCALDGRPVISRVIETAPVGVIGDPFLNAVVGLCSGLTPEAVKVQLLGIEAALGRDHRDPQRKTRSRPADIDILLVLAEDAHAVPAAELPTEPYLRPQVLEVLAYLGIATDAQAEALPAGTALRYGKQWIGTGPTVIGGEG
jgi:2-amino-4-hydroxy-6-hydroxymethyldihydropteridine diphosphokinase